MPTAPWLLMTDAGNWSRMFGRTLYFAGWFCATEPQRRAKE